MDFLDTRTKPPYGRQGLAGSWGKDTISRVYFGVFSTAHFLVTDGGVLTDLSGHSFRK